MSNILVTRTHVLLADQSTMHLESPFLLSDKAVTTITISDYKACDRMSKPQLEEKLKEVTEAFEQLQSIMYAVPSKEVDIARFYYTSGDPHGSASEYFVPNAERRLTEWHQLYEAHLNDEWVWYT